MSQHIELSKLSGKGPRTIQVNYFLLSNYIDDRLTMLIVDLCVPHFSRPSLTVFFYCLLNKKMQIAAVVGLVLLVDGFVHYLASHLAALLFWRETLVIGKQWISFSNWSVTGHLSAIAALFLAFSLVQSYLFRQRAFQYFRRLGIPGPKPHLIKGNGDKMRNQSLLPIDVMDGWQAQYGDLYGYFVGLKPYVVVKDLDMVQQILIRDFHKFVNRPSMGIEIRPVINTLVGLRSQRWKEVRRVISPTFSRRKMRKISLTINRCVDILVEVVGKHADTNTEMDFYSVFQGLTCQVNQSFHYFRLNILFILLGKKNCLGDW